MLLTGVVVTSTFNWGRIICKTTQSFLTRFISSKAVGPGPQLLAGSWPEANPPWWHSPSEQACEKSLREAISKSEVTVSSNLITKVTSHYFAILYSLGPAYTPAWGISWGCEYLDTRISGNRLRTVYHNESVKKKKKLNGQELCKNLNLSDEIRKRNLEIYNWGSETQKG